MDIKITIPDDKSDLFLDGFCAATRRPADSKISREEWFSTKSAEMIKNAVKAGQGALSRATIAEQVDSAAVTVEFAAKV